MSLSAADKCIRSTHLVLLPGMMCDERLWSAQTAALSADLKIVQGSITGGETVEHLAARLLATLPDRFALAGLSMGGIVAFEMWRQAPERIERLALLDTNFRPDAPERRALRDRQIADVNAGGLEAVLRDELKPNYLAVCHQGDQALLDRVIDMGMALGEEVFIAQSRALRDRPDSRSTLGGIACPTLVACGDEDRLCPPDLHEEMAGAIPGAGFHCIANCGHLSPMEQPLRTSKLLRQWLAAPHSGATARKLKIREVREI